MLFSPSWSTNPGAHDRHDQGTASQSLGQQWAERVLRGEPERGFSKGPSAESGALACQVLPRGLVVACASGMKLEWVRPHEGVTSSCEILLRSELSFFEVTSGVAHVSQFRWRT